jgi:hypothetical protein
MPGKQILETHGPMNSQAADSSRFTNLSGSGCFRDFGGASLTPAISMSEESLSARLVPDAPGAEVIAGAASLATAPSAFEAAPSVTSAAASLPSGSALAEGSRVADSFPGGPPLPITSVGTSLEAGWADDA